MRIVILTGKESFLIADATRALIETLTAAHDEIEQFRFDAGEGLALATVLDELRSYGLMQQHKLVIVDNAASFLNEDSRPAMERYAEKPVDHATLLLRSETWRPGKIDKIVTRTGLVQKFDEVAAPAASRWVETRASTAHRVKIEPAAAALLVERLGTNLTRLDTELGKLAAVVDEKAGITKPIVEDMVARSREEQFWAIQNAIVQGRPEGTLRAVRDMVDISRVDPVALSWSLMDLARKLHAVSRLLREGEPAGAISKRLKLWGQTQAALLRAGEKTAPREAARLFRETVAVDRKMKSGLLNSQRGVEGQALLLTDKFR